MGKTLIFSKVLKKISQNGKKNLRKVLKTPYNFSLNRILNAPGTFLMKICTARHF